PFSSILPVPKATTFPSCGFSVAVSGIMIPPFFISCSSIGCTSTRSPSGLTLTVAIGCFCYSFWFCFWVEPATADPCDQRSLANCSIIFSCLRLRLRTRHRQRRLRACPCLLRRHHAVALQVRVVGPGADPLALMLACKARR